MHADIAIKKRFVKRQKRGQTRGLPTKRDGVGYSSGKYSGAQKSITDDSGSEEGNTYLGNISTSTIQAVATLVRHPV